MRVIKSRNVNDAWLQGHLLLKREGVHQYGRTGDVLELPDPVTVVYAHPTERVLLDPWRRANPFFHLFEALWMLAGRNDVEFLIRYNARFREYAEPNGLQHGAYGHRWRCHFDRDQLEEAVHALKKNSCDRRVVVAMWDPRTDLGAPVNDVPCNTQVYFKVRDGALNMMVTNRSNDIVWGLFGANAVHFSVLQEYVAAQIGVDVGRYVHVTDSFHAYPRVFDRLPTPLFAPIPAASKIVTKPSKFDSELNQFLDEALCMFCDQPNYAHNDDGCKFLQESRIHRPPRSYENSFFHTTARPMREAWDAYKSGQVHEALRISQRIQGADWHAACLLFLSTSKKL